LLKSRLVRSALTVVPALGIMIAAGTATTGVASAAPAPAPARAALGSISCTSATFCMAVGGNSATMPTQVAAEWWDGHHWHRLSIPKPGGFVNVALTAVSCPSATECVAVGVGWPKSGNSAPIAETWTHSGGWKTGKPVVPVSVGDGISQLNAISCPSASLCYAAGAAGEFSSVTTEQLPLLERWTPRGGWTLVKLTIPRGWSENMLSGISCKSATQCAAVGSYSTSTNQYGLIEQLKGSAWSASTAPKSADGMLNAVSCPSTSLCVAVGLVSSHNLAERWSGGKWTATTPPGPASSGGLLVLNGISCASTTHCVAVGGTLTHAFVDTLRGTTWTKTAQYGPGFKVGELFTVSCFSVSAKATSCAAVGGTTSIDATSVPLSAFLAGSKWSIVATV
jgi:hypothetical protein